MSGGVRSNQDPILPVHAVVSGVYVAFPLDPQVSLACGDNLCGEIPADDLALLFVIDLDRVSGARRAESAEASAKRQIVVAILVYDETGGLYVFGRRKEHACLDFKVAGWRSLEKHVLRGVWGAMRDWAR